jgi:translation elongation factor EF-Tu-like GTPase
MVMPGDNVQMVVTLIAPIAMEEGQARLEPRMAATTVSI